MEVTLLKYKISVKIFLIFVIIISFAFLNDKYIKDVFAQDLTVIDKEQDETGTNEVDDFVNETLSDGEKANLTVNKSVNRAKAIIGDVLEYTIIVTNTGEKVLNEIKVIDNLKSGPITLINNGAVNDLKPQESVIFLGSYSINQIDVVDNKIINVAEVSAICDTGEKITVKSNETITSIINSGLKLKTKVNNETPLPGETITFNYIVTNIGINPIKDVKVNDGNALGSKPVDVLVPGQTVIFTVNYTIPETVDPGSVIESSATCIGKDIDNNMVESELSSVSCIVAEIEDNIVNNVYEPEDMTNYSVNEPADTTEDVQTFNPDAINENKILPGAGEKIVQFFMNLFDKLKNLFK